MNSQRKRMIQMYEQIIVTEKKVELPSQTLMLTFKYSTEEDRHHLRINGSKYQYILDHFVLAKLEMIYKENYPNNQDPQKYYAQKSLAKFFMWFFDYEIGRPLIIRDLNLLIRPFPAPEYYQKGTQQYEIYNRREDLLLKFNFEYEMTVSHLAFLVLSFLKKYSPREDDRPQLSLREKIVMLLLDQNNIQLSMKAKQHLLAYFDFNFKNNNAENKKVEISSNRLVYNQKRLKNAQIHSSLLFNPTMITCEITNIDIGMQEVLLLKGMGGVGKSCSLALIVQHCKLATDFRYNNPRQFNCLVRDKIAYELVPKYIYLSLSQDYEVQNYRGSIESQIHPSIVSKLNKQNRPTFISKMIKEYEEKQIRVVFLIDQINIYFSCIRKCQQNEEKQAEQESRRKKEKRSASHQIETSSAASVPLNLKRNKKGKHKQREISANSHFKYFTCLNQFYSFHKDLTRNSAKIIYSSSSIFQRYSHIPGMPKWFMYDDDPYIDLNINSYIVNVKDRATQDGFREMIEVIWFEMEVNLRKMKKIQTLSALRQEKKVIIHQIPQKLLQNYESLPIGLTHLRIFNFLKNNEDIKRFSPANIPFHQIPDQKEAIITNFQNFLQKVLRSCLIEFIKDFNRFLNKGSLSLAYQKYELFNQIKLYCELNFNSKDIVRFKPKTTSLHRYFFDFDNLIDQDHGRIQDQYVVLNYPPQFFIQIVQNIQRDFFAMDPILRKLIKTYGSINSVFGSMFDNCCTKIITFSNVSLTLGEMTFNLKSILSKTFQHFYPGQADVDIRHKLQDVFRVLDDYEQWIAASPSVKFPNLRAPKSEHSVASRCVDCLLIKKAGQDQYSLRTIDFAMTFSKSKINWKITKAKAFFAEFFSNAKKANLKFALEHFIIVRHQIPQSRQVIEFQEIQYSISVFSVLDLKIQYLEQLDENRHDDCTRSLFKCFMESLSKDGGDQ